MILANEGNVEKKSIKFNVPVIVTGVIFQTITISVTIRKTNPYIH